MGRLKGARGGDPERLRLDVAGLVRELEALPPDERAAHVNRALVQATERLQREIAEAEAIITAGRCMPGPETPADGG